MLAGLATSPALAQSAVSWSGAAPATSGTAGGAGTWNTSGLNWWNGTSGVAWDNSGNNTAVFAGTSGSVALGSNITAGGLTFNTAGYLLSAGTNAGTNTLTLGAASNTLSLNAVTTATISGLVVGTGNVRLDGGKSLGTTAGTLNLIGTATGGWSGTTTIVQGQTLALSGLNQALRNTAAINLNRGTITLTNANVAAEATLDRVSDTAAITVTNGGQLSWSATAARKSSETIGAVSVASGEFQINLATLATSGTHRLTLGGLSRSSNTASVRFSGNGGVALNSTIQQVVVTSATATSAGQIIGPWATAGGDYVTYNASGNVLPANISASNQNTWATAANAYTASTAQTLSATRTIAALRLTTLTSGTALTVASGANLETYGILTTQSATSTQTLAIVATGTGAITTPSGGGNLFIANNATVTGAADNFFSIDAPIIDNGGAVTVVKTGPGILRLQGTNAFTGGLVLNSGRFVFNADAALGAAGGGVTINGSPAFVLPGGSVGSGRTFTVNDGAVLALTANSGTVAANVTGSGGVSSAGSAGTVTFTLSSTANSFTGPVSITQGALAAASLADGSGVGPVNLYGGSGGVTTFRWTGDAKTFTNREFLLGTTSPTDTGAIQNNGSGALTVASDIGFFGTVAARRLTLNGTSTGFSNEFSGKLTDPAGGVLNLTKDQGGTWILSAANTYTGTTTLTAGD
ncbi:MAG: beta strand repeat-containing protein, partial [Ilumatobacteraceae bacterium]